MGIKSALLWYKKLISDDEASRQIRDTNELKVRTLQALRGKGIHKDSFEYRIIKGNRISDKVPTSYLSNSMLNHLSSYSVMEIIEACLQISPVLPTGSSAITAEQIDISRSLYFLRNPAIENHASSDEYEGIVQYAMTHPEEWDLVRHIVIDREIRTLQGITDLLPVLKTSGHSTLTEGVL